MRLNHDKAKGLASNSGVARVASGALAALMIVGLVSCSHRLKDEQRFQLKGRVVNVDKRGSAVTIAHEPISGYMEAMMMPFKLKDSSLLNVMADGDRVQATLVVAGARSWLEDVV